MSRTERTQLFCNLLRELALPRRQVSLHSEDFAVFRELFRSSFPQHVSQPAILQILLGAEMNSCLKDSTTKSAPLSGTRWARSAALPDLLPAQEATHTGGSHAVTLVLPFQLSPWGGV